MVGDLDLLSKVTESEDVRKALTQETKIVTLVHFHQVYKADASNSDLYLNEECVTRNTYNGVMYF